MSALSLWLLCVVLLLILIWLTPPAADCFIPMHAPTRGFYESCWGFWEIWA